MEADVSANIAALNADTHLTKIMLTDTGTPTLALTAAQVAADTFALGKISNASYAVAVTDTAANVLANIAALNANTHLSSIMLTDAGTPILALTASQVVAYASALGKIGNTGYAIAVTDTTANVLANIAALNANTHLSDITLTDAGTPTLALTAAQVAADAFALGNISNASYAITVTDTAANVTSNIAALNANLNVSSITLTGTGTQTLALNATQALGDTVALGKISNATFNVAVTDTSANIAANIAALNADTRLSSLTISGTGTQTLALTAAQVVGDTVALGKISNTTYNIAVTDSAADVSANIAALNATAHLTSITLTGTPTLTLTAAQAVGDTVALGKISTTSYTITVNDTAANIAANIAALNTDTHVTAITLTDTGTPTLTLTSAQVAADTVALAKIQTVPFDISVSDTGAVLTAQTGTITSGANAGDTWLELFNADGTEASYTLNDLTGVNSKSYTEYYNHGILATESGKFTSGANVGDTFTYTFGPTGAAARLVLTDTAGHYSWSSETVYYDSNGVLRGETVVEDSGYLGEYVYNSSGSLLNSGVEVAATSASGWITSGTYEYDVGYNGSVEDWESVKYISGVDNGDTELYIFNASGGYLSLAFTDTNDAVGYSYTRYYNGTSTALSEFGIYDSGSGSALVGDTFSDIFASGVLSTQTVNDITGQNGSSYTNSYNSSGVLLSQNGIYDSGVLEGVSYVTTYNSAGTVTSYTATLGAAQALGDTAALSQINTAYNVAISDTASNVVANITALNADARLTKITLTDTGTPTLALTAAQVAGNTVALGMIGNASYAVAVTDTAANVLANIAALNANIHLTSITLTDTGTPIFALTAAQVAAYAFALGRISNASYAVTVADTAANVLTNIAALNANSHLSSIALTDTGIPTLALTAAQEATYAAALSKIGNSNYIITVTDTAANVSTNLAALNANLNVSSITLTGTGTQTLALNAAQALGDTVALGKISNATFNVAVTDTAANIAANIAALNADTCLTSLMISGTGTQTLALTATQATDTVALGKISNATYNVAVTDSASNISANIAALNATTHLSSITLTDTGTLTLTAAQALSDTLALGKIGNANYTITIDDTAADIAANIAALNSNTHVTAITLTDNGTPTLILTSAEVAADTAVLAKITNAFFDIAISGTGTIIASGDGLVTTQKIDSDGNGTFEQVDVTTRAPDGSSTEVMQYYTNAGANAGKLTSTSTLTTSANGLVTVLSTSTGVTDTTTTLPNANGSYQWARSVTGTATGLSNGSASHDIDANGIDTWSWSDGSPGGTSGTITIDQVTESQDVATANMIYTTVLGHAMTDAETQYLGQYITNGVLNRTALANSLVNSAEYAGDYGGVPLNPSGFTFQVYEDFLNVLGRLPTTSELATFDPASMQSATITPQILAQTAIAIAQYATDWTGGGVSALAGSGQELAASFPQLTANFAPPVGPAQDYVIGYGGSGGSGFWTELAGQILANGATITIPLDGSATVSGSNDTINASGSNNTVTLSGTGDSLTLGSGGAATVTNSGNTVISSGNSITDDDPNGTLTVVGSNNLLGGIGSNEHVIDDQTVLASGVSNEIDDFLINNGAITQTSSDLNFIAGGSEGILFNPTGSVSKEAEYFAGENETGALKDIDENFTSGKSEVIEYNPSSSVSQEIVEYEGLNETGGISTEYVNFTAGNSEEVIENPQSGVSQEIIEYTGANESGASKTYDELVSNDSDIELSVSDATIVVGSNDTVNADAGSGDTIEVVGSGDYIYALGDTIYVANGYSADVYGGEDTGYGSITFTTPNAPDDTDNGVNDDPDPPGDPFGGSGPSSGVAAAVVRQMNVIAEYDLGHGFTAAAAAAETSWNNTNQAIAASQSSSAPAPSPFNGIRWAPGSVVTWSFAAPSGAGADPVSGAIQGQYQAIIEQALQTWSAASGLTFEQVASSASADFQIGWGDFETTTSGLVGYTSHAGMSGGKAQSLLVRLEDPGEDPLTAGADGALAYAGTQTTLYQAALHEIGHVLGIAETSDPSSVMYPLLGPENTTLNGTDLKDLAALYGSTGTISSLIGRSTADQYAIPTPSMRGVGNTEAGASTFHFDPSLFDGGATFDSMAAGGVAGSPVWVMGSQNDAYQLQQRQGHNHSLA